MNISAENVLTWFLLWRIANPTGTPAQFKNELKTLIDQVETNLDELLPKRERANR